MHKFKEINIFKLMNMLNKQKTKSLDVGDRVEEKTNDKFDDASMNIRLNRRVASLIICSIAFTIRCMWYYRVEDISVWEYFDREDFDKSYNDLRYFLLFLDMKCEKLYKNYENFKVFVDKK